MPASKYQQVNRRGVTLVELLLTGLLISVLLTAGYNLLMSGMRSSDNLIWQTRVNMEARQALDAIVEYIRVSGLTIDALNPEARRGAMLQARRDGINLLNDVGGNNTQFYFLDTLAGGRTLVRNNSGEYRVSQFIQDITLEFEYRDPTTGGGDDSTWRMLRISPVPGANLTDISPRLPPAIRTVYVTVTAQARPWGNNGGVYTRVLRTAVHLRAPYTAPMPFSPGL